jgi:hypothetical protein
VIAARVSLNSHLSRRSFNEGGTINHQFPATSFDFHILNFSNLNRLEPDAAVCLLAKLPLRGAAERRMSCRELACRRQLILFSLDSIG